MGRIDRYHVEVVRGAAFSYDGKLFKIPETSMHLQPMQKPHPPVWITAQSAYSIEAAVRRGFNVLTGGFGVPIERLAEFGKIFDRVARGQAAAAAIGRRAAGGLRGGKRRRMRDAAEHARWNMRVTLSLRNNYERVENGHAIPIPRRPSPTWTTFWIASWSSGRRTPASGKSRASAASLASRISTAASGSATWSRRACCAPWNATAER